MDGDPIDLRGAQATTDPDRPTLAVAEGVRPYLTGAEVHELLDRLLAHTSSVSLAFDGLAPWAVAVAGVTPTFRRTGAAAPPRAGTGGGSGRRRSRGVGGRRGPRCARR